MTVGKWNIKLLRSSFFSWQPKAEAVKQIAVLMSGGVDSSIAAYLLKEQGWDVLGITMKIPVSVIANSRRCPAPPRGRDAAFVCNDLNIPHYFIDVTECFEEIIIKPFRQSYAKGQTPNPCVDCNTFLKFSLLWDFLDERFGIPYLATGHYAKVCTTDGRVCLGRAKDKAKDQSYFLYGIDREKLARLVLPLGELTKKEVCSIAGGANLPVAEKSESMELCFAGEGDYRAVLTDAAFNKPGDVTDMQGNKIAEHKGIANYTLGQRSGIGFAGGKPLYVGKINAEKNTIALGSREEVSFRTVRAKKINVLIPEELVTEKIAYGKIRSYGDPSGCKVIEASDREMTVEFDEPQFAPCPGQKLVLYDSSDNIIVGGTIIWP